jgi:hypothetical protein
MIAHVAGIPAEEIATSVAGAAASLIAARAWIMVRLRHLRADRT